MWLALINDTHLTAEKPIARLDDAVATQFDKFHFVLDWAQQRNARILHGGDFFDTSRSWRALAMYIRLLREHGDVGIYVVSGQHDDYFYNEGAKSHTALGILVEAGLVKMIPNQGVTIRSLTEGGGSLSEAITAQGYSYGQEPNGEVANVHHDGPRIMVIHKMILMEKLWAKQENYTSAPIFLRRHKDFDLILCGDAHQKFDYSIGKRVICNTGPLLRAEASEEMIKHSPGFYSYNTETRKLTWVSIPHRPASEVLSREHIEETARVDELLTKFIDGLREVPGAEINLSFTDNLLSFISENNVPESVSRIIFQLMKENR